MIVVRTTLNVLPENLLEVEQTLISMVVPVGKQPGCISYCVFCNIDNKNQLTLLEEWENQEDLYHHIQSYRFDVLLGTKMLLSESPRIQIYTIAQTQGMEVIHAARRNKI